MPLAYEYDLDNHAVLVTGWDHVSLGDTFSYYRELTQVPTDLNGCVEYLDLAEVVGLHVCENGALQLASAYEQVVARGLRGVVIHATDDRVRSVIEMIAFTFSEVCGGFEDGYRLTRQPIPAGAIHSFLRGESGEIPKVA